METPFFYLRPNKYIDRLQFFLQLQKLHDLFPFEESYRYVGFGSYTFDDFKLAHKLLSINKLTSLEMDSNSYLRAKYNQPYKHIEIINISSTEYITNVLPNDKATKHYIIWYDFMNVKDIGQQIVDYCETIKQLRSNDIIRVTFNANPENLDNDQSKVIKTKESERLMGRYYNLRNKLGKFFVEDIKDTDLTYDNYPKTLNRILMTNAVKSLEYSSNSLLVMDSTVYADTHQQMVTCTALIQQRPPVEEEREKLKIIKSRTIVEDSTARWSWSWKEPRVIKVPELTVKELYSINELIPTDCKTISDHLKFISEDKINQYMSFYKLYPNFHLVNF